MRYVFALALAAALTCGPVVCASPVTVRFVEGSSHGFVVLRNLSGQSLAEGELLQSIQAGTVKSRLVFHFTDGSLYDDTTIFTQKNQFRLISDHVVEKGPSFKEPSDVLVDAAKYEVTVRHGDNPPTASHLDLPDDVSNGLLLTLLKNVARDTVTRVSMVGGTDTPRLVQLAIHPISTDTFHIVGFAKKAVHFALKTEIGGVTGLLARVTGKVPPDLNIWIATDDPPTFVRFEGPLLVDEPVWRVERAAPTWPR